MSAIENPFYVFCLLAVDDWLSLWVFAVLIGQADVTELGIHRRATSLAGANLGLLRSAVPLSLDTTPLMDTSNPLDSFPSLTTWPIRLQKLLLQFAFWTFHCEFFFVRPGQSGFSRRAALFQYRLRIESLFLFFVCFCFIYAPRWLLSARTSRFLVTISLGYSFCARLEQKLKQNARETIVSGYPRLSKCAIHVFRCDCTLQKSYSHFTLWFLFGRQWIVRVHFCTVT